MSDRLSQTARYQLRDATSESHGRVDASFAAFDLASREQYMRFLSAQAPAYLPVEAAVEWAGIAELLPDWPDRRRSDLLRLDLCDLGITLCEPDPYGPIATRAAAIGAAYVLEGSKLGGQMLARGVPEQFPSRFIRCGGARLWRGFVAMLERELTTSVQIDEAIGEARRVFSLFEASALREARPRDIQ